ncbi:hypothetical protein DFH05DRAFT_551535 [Lentinula detonsa]|uniref:Uncharacterized protein n=1 Tax=Lentinula detonsa TaxID=2804962 RepID=A0A9W8U145_9AGAR|nr:hypothetical protein DFH05DRAFT_551535 [Lentinula detonsa]
MRFGFASTMFTLAAAIHAAPLDVDYRNKVGRSSRLSELESYSTWHNARADAQDPQVMLVSIRFNDANNEVAPSYRNMNLANDRNSDPIRFRYNVPNPVQQRASTLIDSFARAKNLGPANVCPMNDFPFSRPDAKFSFTFRMNYVDCLTNFCWAEVKSDGSAVIKVGGRHGRQIYEYTPVP